MLETSRILAVHRAGVRTFCTLLPVLWFAAPVTATAPATGPTTFAALAVSNVTAASAAQRSRNHASRWGALSRSRHPDPEPQPRFRVQDTPALERGRRLTRWLLAGQTDSVYAQMSEPSRALAGGREGLAGLAGQIEDEVGREIEVVTEEVYTVGSNLHYYRIARFSGLDDRTVTMYWGWLRGGDVVAAQITPTPQPAPTQHEDYQTQTPLELPFAGEWVVFWGGRTPDQNYHVVAPDQRFAYDLLVIREGTSHTGDGSSNTDYHCFGQPILAPAGGRITAAVDSVPDNVPGQMNPAAPPGNYVVIDHGAGEYSLLAHLRRGSVAVQVGDEVETGEALGECGNSGNSSEPHLHYHLQTGPTFGEGVGLPAYFNDYRANGEYVDRGEPVRGQAIRPSTAGSPVDPE